MKHRAIVILLLLGGLGCCAACSHDNESGGAGAGGHAGSGGTGGASGGTGGASGGTGGASGGTGGASGGTGGASGGTGGASGGTGGDSGGTGGTAGSPGNIVGVDGIQAFDQLSNAARDELTKTKVLFGHMSVGGNLVAGYDRWDPPWVAGTNGLGFVFDMPESPSEYDSGVTLGDQVFGENGDPLQKITMFGDWLDSGFGEKVTVAGMKLCYADLLSEAGAGADLDVVQRAYASMMNAARSNNPSLNFFHVTTPLQPAGQWRTKENNQHRIAFGDWLKTTYSRTDVVFDLQAVESTNAGGAACAEDGVPVLCDAWKGDDDGHLSDTGSTRAAKAFLYAIHRAATN